MSDFRNHIKEKIPIFSNIVEIVEFESNDVKCATEISKCLWFACRLFICHSFRTKEGSPLHKAGFESFPKHRQYKDGDEIVLEYIDCAVREEVVTLDVNNAKACARKLKKSCEKGEYVLPGYFSKKIYESTQHLIAENEMFQDKALKIFKEANQNATLKILSGAQDIRIHDSIKEFLSRFIETSNQNHIYMNYRCKGFEGDINTFQVQYKHSESKVYLIRAMISNFSYSYDRKSEDPKTGKITTNRFKNQHTTFIDKVLMFGENEISEIVLLSSWNTSDSNSLKAAAQMKWQALDINVTEFFECFTKSIKHEISPQQLPPIQTGSIIRCYRILYDHAAVYLGNNKIIHVRIDNKGTEDKIFKFDTLESFIAGYTQIEEIRFSLRNFDETELVARAEEMSSKKYQYNLLSNNCEHLATVLVSTLKHSFQVNDFIGKMSG